MRKTIAQRLFDQQEAVAEHDAFEMLRLSCARGELTMREFAEKIIRSVLRSDSTGYYEVETVYGTLSLPFEYVFAKGLALVEEQIIQKIYDVWVAQK